MKICKDKLIGEILIEKGFCSNDEIKKALEIQKSYGEDVKIGRILINMGVITEEQLLLSLAEQFGLEYVESTDDYKFVDIGVKPEILKENSIFPFKEDNATIYALANDPLKIDIFAFIENVTNKKLEILLTIEDNLNKLFGELKTEESTDVLWDGIDSEEEIDKLKELASEAPVIKLVNTILNKAVEVGATDIHFESLKNNLRVRMRIDGILRTFDYIPNNIKLAVIARLKLMSGMNIAENRLAQDGRISLKIAGKSIDVRASSLPTQHGESFVLRILIEENTSYSLDTLGFLDDHVKIIRDISSKPNGIFLTTGPTGSGKTTTLYSVLSELNSDEVKIITVEDPVEYELEGINQVQVKPEIGRTFASALRNILRQDPDIIMIGEIRDKETAEIAIQAALTGHLVLSTLHTNSALASITRLVDMGVEWFLIKASVVGLMAQRLVRKVCPYCSENLELSEEISKNYKIPEIMKKYNISSLDIKKGKGCEHCNYTGYKGRTVIAEVLPFTYDMQIDFERDGNFKSLSEYGYRSMLEDGLVKVLKGVTTFEEVLRVV